MEVGVGLFSRHAEWMAAGALAGTRVGGGARELYLDDQAIRAAAEADPSAFVRHDGLLMIDEIQRVPELLLAIKREVDRDPRPGRFLLTGSGRLLSLRDLPDALPGRTETIELWPLSQGEIDSAADGFVDAVFRLDGNVGTPPGPPTKREYGVGALACATWCPVPSSRYQTPGGQPRCAAY